MKAIPSIIFAVVNLGMLILLTLTSLLAFLDISAIASVIVTFALLYIFVASWVLYTIYRFKNVHYKITTL